MIVRSPLLQPFIHEFFNFDVAPRARKVGEEVGEDGEDRTFGKRARSTRLGCHAWSIM